MNSTKFSVNALLIVLTIFSALAFFFTIKMLNLADTNAVNEFYPIEGTEYGVRYSSREPDGIYKGTKNSCTIMIEGTYGYDWGAALEGDRLYVNEYRTSELGMSFCDLVMIDTSGFEKKTLYKNTVLRGRCASGELVCVSGAMMQWNFPKTNSLCRLYAVSSPELDPDSDSATVLFIDPVSGNIAYSIKDESALSDGFEEKYLERTLGEVKE